MTDTDYEPMTDPAADRLSFMPITNEPVYEMQQKAQVSYWIAKEVDLSKDIADYTGKLSPPEQHLLNVVLAFFSQADGLVMKNLAVMFMAEVTMPEAFNFYAVQVAVESVHNEMYSRIIWALVPDYDTRMSLLNAVVTMACIKRKADWTKRWMDPALPFVRRVMGFAVVEGVFFSASFLVIFWFKDRGLLPGTSFSNTLISRDEGLHTDFAVLMFQMCRPKHKPTQAEAEDMFREALLCEEEFVREALPEPLLGINADSMIQYVRFCADRLLVDLGYRAIWNTTNPFSFMDNISIDGYANFFENKDANYQRGGVMDSTDDGKVLDFNADF